MRQALHIVRKDTRRFAWMIGALLLLVAVRTWATPRYSPVYDGWSRAVDLMHLALLLGWWLIAALVIQEECAAGTRQFWVTRPYSWRSLAAAKLAFLVLFLLAPVLIADCTILAMEGFSPWTLLPRLLWHQVLNLVVVMLAALLASLTGSMKQLTGAFLLLVAAVAVLQQAWNAHPISDLALWTAQGGRAEALIFCALQVALVLRQYARRRTAQARWILAAAFVWWFGSPWLVEALGPNVLPEFHAGLARDVGIRFDPTRERLDFRGASGIRGQVQVDLPVELTGRDRDLLDGEAIALTLDGSRWNGRMYLVRMHGRDWFELRFTEAEWRRWSSKPLVLRADFALVAFRKVSEGVVPRAGQWTRLSGFGDVRIVYYEGPPLVVFRRPLTYPSQRLVFVARARGGEVLGRGEWNGTYSAEPHYHLNPMISFAAGFGDRTSYFGVLPAEVQVSAAAEEPVALVKRGFTVDGLGLSDWAVLSD